MVLNAAELVSMESILFLSAMFQACQFSSLRNTTTQRGHTHRHTQRHKCTKVYTTRNIVSNREMLS